MINDSKKLAGPFLIDLKNRFREIAGSDQLIDIIEFQSGLKISNDQVSRRLFEIFDKDQNGTIDYTEFMGTIESMVNGTAEEKIRFAFELHDLDGNGFIDRQELQVLIQQSFHENKLEYDEFQLDLLVDEFFNSADKDNSGTIDYGEFLGIANDHPDFLDGFAVNPLHWLIPDRYESKKEIQNDDDKKRSSIPSLQVQDLSFIHWLLTPRLVFMYNVLANRKKNRCHVGLQSIKLLPSKILELTITAPKNFSYLPGDYVYLNCLELSSIEWYPFNIIQKTTDGDLVLHIKSSNAWTHKFYKSTLEFIGKDNTLDWQIRIDGPYGSSSSSILKVEHAILVAAEYGISRIAPILQDILLKIKNEPENTETKRVDLYWLIKDESYFEWFTKMLSDLDSEHSPEFFNYHIYFLDSDPDSVKNRMLYISTDLNKNITETALVDDLWSVSRLGVPDWSRELSNMKTKHQGSSKVFYSGPSDLRKPLKRECKKLGLTFQKKIF